MVKSKKSVSNDAAEARPIGEGKDPLAEGNTLENPSNTEAETHYNIKERSEDVAAQDAQNKIDGQDANERAEEHNAQVAPASSAPNSDTTEQDAVAEGRVEEAPAETASEPAEEVAPAP